MVTAVAFLFPFPSPPPPGEIIRHVWLLQIQKAESRASAAESKLGTASQSPVKCTYMQFEWKTCSGIVQKKSEYPVCDWRKLALAAPIAPRAVHFPVSAPPAANVEALEEKIKDLEARQAQTSKQNESEALSPESLKPMTFIFSVRATADLSTSEST